LIVVAALLAGTAVFLRLRRHAAPIEEHASVHDATEVSITPLPEPDATVAEAVPPDAAVVVPHDAALAVRASDAALAVRASDAATGHASDAALAAQGDAGVDKLGAAKALYDNAHDALDEGDFARAFELADESLKLRKTARTYLLLAQAQQRLDRIDDAIASVDAAAAIAPEFSAVWELRGRILWAARRRDEAREAFDKFLQLDPNSPKAASIQRLMNEPR
jgi:tetratricopeptide (TPR) repeat protein